MEPRIQYAKTSDGVDIAYWTMGEGPPLVYVWSMPFSNVQIEWQIPEVRRLYERIGKKHQLIRFDARGCGMSAGDVGDFSLDAYSLDLEAVVERLGLKRFALMAFLHAGPVAIAYSVRNPAGAGNSLFRTFEVLRIDGF